MSSGVVRASLCRFITEPEFRQDVERSKTAREQVNKFLQVVTEDSCVDLFDTFASNLVKRLEKCLYSCDVPFRSSSVRREKLWVAFQRIRLHDIEKLWCDLFAQDKMSSLSPLVYQNVTQRLYSDMIISHLSSAVDTHHPKVPALTADEECVLRYAAGFVPFKLLKRYEKSSPTSSVDIVGIIECLSSMAIDGDESSLLEYTTKWIQIVNRGGLFEIGDTAYILFKEIELKIRKHLFLSFEKISLNDKQRGMIIEAVASEEYIQFYWTLISSDIESEEEAVKLLKEVIGLWLTIRGYSISNAWIEHYKKITKSAKSKGLRKELKRLYDTSDDTH